MATEIPEIMDAIEDRFKAIPTIRTAAAVGIDVPVSGQASVAVVMAPDIPDYRSTMGRGTHQLGIDALVLVSKEVDRVGQRKLARLASQTGDLSVRAAIEAEPTLGGLVNQIYLGAYRNLGAEEVGVIGYFGGIFSFRISASGV